MRKVLEQLNKEQDGVLYYEVGVYSSWKNEGCFETLQRVSIYDLSLIAVIKAWDSIDPDAKNRLLAETVKAANF